MRGGIGQRRGWAILLCALALLAIAAQPLAAKDVPFLSGRVNDTAGLLSPEIRQKIEEQLKALEQQTGSQVAVLTIDSLDGDVLEDYSHKVAQTWGLGKKGKDNGVLLLISKGDRKIRIEVGYGLEGQLTDLQSHVIIDEIMRPEFQRGDFAGGIEKGVDAIASAVSGKGVPTPERPAGGRAKDMPAGGIAIFVLIFLVVIGTFSLLALSSSGCQSWFLYLFLTPFYFTFPMAIGGPALGIGLALGWLILFPLLRLLFGHRKGGGGFWRGGGGPIVLPGGFGGGGWGGGGGFSGGGGGFSAGGGSFGGGGASGGW